ncbi:hypothetical protein ACFLT4_05560 [Chloroflexota bacterium]
MGLRYDGKLQSIYHVELCKIVDGLHSDIPEIEPKAINESHFLYVLGDPIIPSSEVRNGTIWPNGRYERMIDLLLTCNTISEARDLTKQCLYSREASAGQREAAMLVYDKQVRKEPGYLKGVCK